MKQRHLAIFTEMGNGHVFPILPLSTEINDRGYRVTCAASVSFAEHVHAAGAEVVPFRVTPVDDALQAENEERFRRPATDLARFEFSELEWSYLLRSNGDFLAQTLKFYEKNPPDLILYNRYSISGRIIAHRLGLPAIQLSPHFAYHGRSRFWDRGTASNPAELVAYGARLDSLLAEHGLTTEQNLWHVEPLNIHFVPRGFQYQSYLFDDRFFFSGSLLGHPAESRWRHSEARLPLVLISGYSGLPATQTSNLRYFETLIAALADQECHCILSIGSRLNAKDLQSLPANFEINQHASNREILPHVDLFVCHGGMGSSLEALYNGVPVLGLPNTPYTEEVAYRTAELDVGRMFRQREIDIVLLRELVMQMLNDRALRQRALEIQHTFRRSGGVNATADRVESYLKDFG